MSEATPDTLTLEEALVRIQRMRVESDKFQAEQRKLIAEAEKFNRDRFLAPITASIALLAALASLAAAYISHH